MFNLLFFITFFLSYSLWRSFYIILNSLHIAVYNEDKYIVELLLDNGANPNIEDSYGISFY